MLEVAARLNLSKITEYLSFMETMSKRIKKSTGLNFRVENESFFVELYSKNEGKWLNRVRNHFAHGSITVNEDGTISVDDRGKTSVYTLHQQEKIISRLHGLSLDERLEIVGDFEVECKVCGQTVDAQFELPCGHGIYESEVDPSSPPLARKPSNGILRASISFGKKKGL